MSLFSKNLRFLRKRGKYNQDEISLLFKKRANTIGNWENQKSEPSLAELIILGEFFTVSVQDMLHTDLEKESLSADVPAPGQPYALVKTYQAQDPVGIANDSNPDTFWLILRELKALNEKLDTLFSGIQSIGFYKNSDKSNH
ncbi:MAG TPA: helix-turn-helix transcriptional regulator [Puia sp.]|jgi:transcriptional regulator with XRE-family HTH domain